MNIVIVAKTRMGTNCICIGGLSESDGMLIRLLPSNGMKGWPSNTDLQIGDTWRCDVRQVNSVIAPHVEDHVVRPLQKVRRISSLSEFICKHYKPMECGFAQLFDGFLRFTVNRHGFISHRSGVPANSVAFWRPNTPLYLIREQNGAYYSLDESSRSIKIKYVGLNEPLNEIPAGDIIRLSLARWWSPPGSESMEERCYLQLSGWYSQEELTSNASRRRISDDSFTIPEADLYDDYGDGWLDYDPREDFDETWGGMFVSGSDDPPGDQVGSDYIGCEEYRDDPDEPHT